jgi:hypothetical protein
LAQIHDDIFDGDILVGAYFVTWKLRVFAGYRVVAPIKCGLDLNSVVDYRAFYVEFLTLTSNGFFLK